MRALFFSFLLLASLVLFAHPSAFAGDGDEPAADASAQVVAALEAGRSRFAPCAYVLGAPAPELASLSLVVRVDARGRARSEVGRSEISSRSLSACLARSVSRVLSRQRPRLVGPLEVTFRPFADLPRPLPAREAPVLATRDQVVALDRSLASGTDDAERLLMLSAEIENGRAVPSTAAPQVLRRIPERTMEAALILCGMTVGADARARIEGALPANQRAYFHAVTEAGCGAQANEPSPTPSRPPGDECRVDADCVMIPRTPPECCGNPCRGGVAVPRADAERLGRACQGVRPARCPAMACAFEESYAACAEGRCVARSERQLGRP